MIEESTNLLKNDFIKNDRYITTPYSTPKYVDELSTLTIHKIFV